MIFDADCNMCIRVLGPKGTRRARWFFTITLCVKEKFGNSYKDIPDEKFDDVVKYIEFLKQNPS